MRYYIISGEASGDLHGSNLMRALLQEDPQTDFRFWGGDLMEDVGGKLVKHYRDLAFMGFWEVVTNLSTILGNLRFCKEDILNFSPDVLVLIDYPGFNLRIAKWAKEKGIRVFYYISPQLWAWHSSRVKVIKEVVDRLFVILPFEKDFYAEYDYDVSFVGHPLLDVVDNYEAPAGFREQAGLSDAPIVALLPGSRKQEISRMLEIMLEAVLQLPADFQYVIAGAPSQDESFYNNILDPLRDRLQDRQVSIIFNQTYPLLAEAEVAAVTSGTATLEAALFGVPQVVCYKGNEISYHIAKRLVNVDYISLVNLIHDGPLVTELIQQELTPDRLAAELKAIWPGTNRHQDLKAAYQALKEKLGGPGASQRTATEMVERLQSF
jgi:lipid-A-disaccharide synthase